MGYHLSVPVVSYRNQSAYPVSCSPFGKLKRAAFNRHYTWHFSMQGLPECIIAYTNCELLPHIFTFVRLSEDSYFLWHFLFPVTGTRLFTGALLCTVRTFLPNRNWNDSQALQHCKDNFFWNLRCFLLIAATQAWLHNLLVLYFMWVIYEWQ